MAKEEYPSVPPQHDTDRVATALVDLWMAQKWLVRRLPLDYGLDGLIEPIVDGHPGGKHFFFQQKGTRGLRFDASGRASWRMETSHLRYYRDRAPLPVFLLLVDAEAGAGWFCLLQSEIRRLGKKVDEQDSIAVSLRVDRMIRDYDTFFAAVDVADDAIGEQRPSSLQTAFRLEVQRHESIDPNFKVVKAEVSDGQTCLTLAPAQPFSFTITPLAAKSNAAVSKIRDLFQFGQTLKLTTNEAEFSGLPLFDWAKARGLVGHLTFRPERSFDCQVTISGSKPNSFSLSIPARLSGGEAGILIEGALINAPLGIKLKAARDALAMGRSTTILLTWDLDRWKGADLRRLPWIEPITGFWRALFACQNAEVVISLDGNRLTSGNFGSRKPSADFEPHFRICEMLLMAHELSISRNLAIVVPDINGLLGFDWSDLEVAHGIDRDGRYEGSGANIRAPLVPAAGNEQFENLKQRGLPCGGWARFVYENYAVKVLDNWIELGKVQCEVGPIVCRQVVHEDRPEEFAVELIGEADTRIMFTRC